MTYIQHRLNEVRRLMKEKKIPALLVTQPQNSRYLSGFTGGAGELLITPQRAILSTDSRYWEQAAQQAPDFTLHRSKGKPRDYLPGLLEAAGNPSRLAYEASGFTVAKFDEFKTATPKIKWIKTTELVEKLRYVKDADEIAQIRQAIDLAEEGYNYLMQILKPGMTEHEVAWDLEVYLRTHGADGLGFETIIASGPNSALPHYEGGHRVIREGEPLIIDWGARVDGYRSDMTRTIVLGQAGAKFHEVYDTVLRAQRTAIEKMKAGMISNVADALARDVIVAAGYGDNFGHGLGHGVGLATHEGPRATYAVDDETIPAGSVITIEPGIYIPGWGGVRIEDMVLVKEDGVEVLTHLPK